MICGEQKAGALLNGPPVSEPSHPPVAASTCLRPPNNAARRVRGRSGQPGFFFFFFFFVLLGIFNSPSGRCPFFCIFLLHVRLPHLFGFQSLLVAYFFVEKNRQSTPLSPSCGKPSVWFV
ncbi:hypothetical protein FN846DRAFT_969207 [Sphaerosporella brunnea]|uniref:Uncharacterized protein n=1 Tax=Sphaerosporella brunnea TaxID=1250544 RepID=A0A5J5ELC1_9PEZI|nr:hypothetical protein FN846DRAFT_969207 [Sphaerosporella brunnea]